MRIVLAIPSLRSGGAERVMSILASHWAHSGHEVSLATFDPPSTDFFDVDPRVSRHVIGESGETGVHWLRANRGRIRALRSVVRDARPDVVLSFLSTMNLVALMSARKLAPVVVAERTDPSRVPIGWWQALLRRALYPGAAALVVQTDEVRERWGQRVMRNSNLAFTVPNPVLPPSYREWRGAPLPDRFIAFVGRLDRRKGCDVLIEAFALIAPAHPEWSLVLLGDGPEEERLAEQAAALGVAERVYLLGVGDSGALLSRAGLFASASRLEGFPNAHAEALARGIPVVATDSGSGVRAVVRHGVDGLLTPLDDAPALAAALDTLLGDDRLREGFGRHATEVLERLSLERADARWHEVFARARWATR